MITKVPSHGIETPISMMMLIFAISLITAGATFLLNEDTMADSGDLRSFQVERIGVSTVRLIEERHLMGSSPILQENSSEIIVWTGQAIITTGNISSMDGTLNEVLSLTPDGLWSMIWIGVDGSSPPVLLNDVTTWEWDFLNGIHLTIYLPISRCPYPDPEVMK